MNPKLQEKDKTVIHRILDKVISISLAPNQGEVNRVYIVERSTGKAIVRLNNESDFPRFKKEAWCLETATRQGILSPKLLDFGVKDDCAFMVLEYIPGLNGKDIKEDKSRIWKKIGEYAKKINSVSTYGFGERLVSPGSFADTWDRYLDYNISSLNENDKLLGLKVLTPENLNVVKDRFVSLKEKELKFGLIHGDLSLENVIVDNAKITLIDWGVAQSSIVPHMELVDLLQNILSDESDEFKNFLEGYGMSVSEYESIKQEMGVLNLLQAVDKLRWAIDKSPDLIEEKSQIVKKALL